MQAFKRKVTRVKDDAYVSVEIQVTASGRLTVCGEAGNVTTPAFAKGQALALWESFFEDSPEERRAMAERFGRTFRTAKSAARFVVQSDGDYHGLDATERGGMVYIAHSFGQIREEIVEFFPEVAPLFAWHLNDLRSGCEEWRKVELPEEIIELARTVCADEE